MVLQIPPDISGVVYPDSDGKPMSDNTKQFRWIVVVKENLEWLFANDANVFVAGDLLWYPVEGNNKTRQAPDAMVVFGRPKGDRGSYQQWKEEGIPPQVVFEILSPGNTRAEMNRKLLFYDRYGVEEYYMYDPDTNQLNGWLRQDDFLDMIDPINDWVSPRLQIRFDLSGTELQIRYPNGEPFLTYVEIAQRVEQERQRAEQAEQALQDAIPKLLEMGLSAEQVAAALAIALETVQQVMEGRSQP
ncbi:MAG: Uma2 family endonuclease [Oscillatoriales cyanobacterium C42_A2020_001]|nr:Uma2 family endonuclease [Leptolyngbyaceae cyanobacterium C42_A2020_001]